MNSKHSLGGTCSPSLVLTDMDCLYLSVAIINIGLIIAIIFIITSNIIYNYYSYYYYKYYYYYHYYLYYHYYCYYCHILVR